jgi:hypothetical protein
VRATSTLQASRCLTGGSWYTSIPSTTKATAAKKYRGIFVFEGMAPIVSFPPIDPVMVRGAVASNITYQALFLAKTLGICL